MSTTEAVTEKEKDAETEAGRSDQQSVIFRLGNESYGIDIFSVNEIIRMREITPIPQTDAHICGLVNLRGKTIPVVNLHVRLALPEVEESDKTRIIVVDSPNGNVGIIVDEVNEVVTLSAEHIEETPAMVTDEESDYVYGVARLDDRLITLLDLDKALAA
ncbi:MAG: purine-binding chemotaxis protein CheW [Armatimonadetes bacterium]|nr:purine-binding chemotaxis protein CheW [Armatimonadota bacterium]